VELDVPEPEPTALLPREMPLAIVHVDDHVIVVDKPAGLVVHPGPGHLDDTLLNGLLARFGALSPVGEPLRGGVVHRIDADTTGLLVVARTERAHAHLAAQFAAHDVDRVYRAVAWGTRIDREGTFRTLHGRHPRDRKKFSSGVPRGKRAVTHWKVVRELAPCVELELRLETGRTHQIRVHFADGGHPLVGDPMYGGRRRVERPDALRQRGVELGLARQALHAARLGFVHPVTGASLVFESPLPQDMAALLALLEEVNRP
jgi:23S rRNA pseudouridine1911/1915/1917 synthase